MVSCLSVVLIVYGILTEESIGKLFFGLFTPTEAAAVGAFGVLVVSLIRRKLTWQGFINSLYETLKTSCMVMLLIASAVVFGKFISCHPHPL